MVGNDKVIVGHITKKVVDTFNLDIEVGKEIYCGTSNIEHMKSEHPEDFEKYGDKLADIINTPTYIAKHPAKSSIEYIKEYVDDKNNLVLVAVRATGGGLLFARTLFVMDDIKVEKYRKKGALKEY